jgi:hypothetical protein
MVTEDLIQRASILLAFMTECEVYAHLVSESVESEDAELAVKAAVILNRE